MGVIWTPREWQSQPPYLSGVNRNNPIGATLVSAVLPSTGLLDHATPNRVFTYGAGCTVVPGTDGPVYSNANQTTAGVIASAGGFSTFTPTTEWLVIYCRIFVNPSGARKVLFGDWNAAGSSVSLDLELNSTNQWRTLNSALVTSDSTAAVVNGWRNIVLACGPNQEHFLWVDGALVMTRAAGSARTAGTTTRWMGAGGYTGTAIGLDSKATIFAVGNVNLGRDAAVAFNAADSQVRGTPPSPPSVCVQFCPHRYQ